jgi:hypothetical protein
MSATATAQRAMSAEETRIVTPRLVLRPWHIDDAEAALAFYL